MSTSKSQIFVLSACLLLICRPEFASPECCPSTAGSCPISFPELLWTCCSYGDCNFFCCNCDAECKTKGCEYTLVNSTFTNETAPEVVMSNVVSCDSNSRESCRINLEITNEFEAEVMSKISLGVPVMRLISSVFYAEYRTTVAEKTSVGISFQCSINPGSKGWLGQEPLYAVLSTTYVYKCCKDDNKSCEFVKSVNFKYRKPIVMSTGVNAGEIHCHDEKRERAANGNKIL